MIHYNLPYGTTIVKTALEFGKGTIKVNSVFNGKEGCVICKSSEKPGIIGEFCNEDGGKGKFADEWKPEVLMSFTNPDSVDVVIEALQKVKSDLLSVR